MMKFLRRNQKKILAIFTAGLMIAFIFDTGYQRWAGGGDAGRGEALGAIGDQTIYSDQVRRAKQELEFSYEHVFLQTNDPRQQFIPLLAQVVPFQALEAMRKEPLAYALLLEEARRMTVSVHPAELDNVVSLVAVRKSDGRIVPVVDAPELASSVRAVVENALLLNSAFRRAADVFKVSEPMAAHTALQILQSITVQFVGFDASQWMEKAPQFDDATRAEHFRKYADVNAGARSDTNPMGFGYRYPPRMKMQYIAVPREQLRQIVKSRKDDYAWELEAQRYYLQHQREFPSTAPASTQPATAPAAPATQPFEQVRERVLERVMAPEINRLADEARRLIQTTLDSDYAAFVKAGAGPTTSPAVASSPGPSYDSYEYLQKLAQMVQQRIDVLPTVVNIAELKSEDELEKIEGLREVAASAFTLAEPLVPPSRRSDPMVLSLWEPSRAQASDARSAGGTGGGTVVYRITSADPAHAPANINEVADKVADDLRKAWAFDQAKEAASKLLERARGRRLADVLSAADGELVTAGPLTRQSFAIPGTEFREPSTRVAFIDESYKLLSQASQQQQHPQCLMQLPAEMKVLAAELAAASTALDEQLMPLARAQAAMELRQMLENSLLGQWFTLPAVSQRLGYVDHTAPPGTPAPSGASAALP